MQLKTILNRVQKFKSFVYGAVRWVEADAVPALEVDIHPRAGSRGRCSGCDRQRAGYDRWSPRRFEFVPLWGIKVFLVYAPRRVDCPPDFDSWATKIALLGGLTLGESVS